MSDKIKVVIATNILDIGGAERTVQTIALYLDKIKFDVAVLCLMRGGPRVKLLEEKGIKVLVGDGTLEKIKQLIPQPNVDVLHFHRSGQNESPLHQAAVSYLRPKKLMETNIFAFNDPVLGPKFDLHVYKSMMMLSQRAWKGLQPKPEDCLKQRVVYNPVTIDYFDQFKLSPERRQELRRNLGVGPNDILLGRIGRNDAVKWGDLVLTALPVIFRNNPRVKVLFRTVPTSRLSWLKKKNFFGGRVIILPESSSEREIAETYQMLDIYIHTSRRGEAFGNSLNEAMAWSLPIIVENTPHWDNGQLEQVDNGKTGWVVSSAGGLAAAAKDLVDNAERRLAFGKSGRQKVVDCFGWRRGVGQYELAYQQLASTLTPSEVLASIYPQSADIISYHEQYQKLRQLDFPHKNSSGLEFKRRAYYWRWRIKDSLISRGFIKV